MNTTFIVNFAGQASPSIIKQLANVTHDHGGKWLITKINYLDNLVAGLIKIELPADNVDAVKQAFLAQSDLSVFFAEAQAVEHDKDKLYQVRFDAQDRAGIVKDISQLLEQEQVQIVNMDSNRVFLVGGGGISANLFTSRLTLKLPAQLTIQDVMMQLESIGTDSKVFNETA